MSKKVFVSYNADGYPVLGVDLLKIDKRLYCGDFVFVNPVRLGDVKDVLQVNIGLLSGCDVLLLFDEFVDCECSKIERLVAEMMGMEVLICSDKNLKCQCEVLFYIIGLKTGLSEDMIVSDKRYRCLVFARMYIAYRLKELGFTVMEISNVLRRSHSNIVYYISGYRDEYKFNSDFKSFIDAVKG